MNKKSIISLGLISGLLFSNGVNAEINACDYDFPYDIEIKQRNIQISDHHKEVLSINADNQLFIRGEKQSLTHNQQQLVDEMAMGYRSLLPSIAAIAGEAAEIGMKAATVALNALFIDDPALQSSLLKKLDGIGEKVKANVSEQHLNGHVLSDDVLNNEFEQEIEALVTEAVEKASGKVLLKTIAQVFSGDQEEINDLEFRMEMMGEDLAMQVESEAEKLEKEAEKLCDKIAELDKVESNLQTALPSYSAINLIKKN